MYGGYYLKYGKLSQVFGIMFSERDKARGVEMKVFEKYLHNSRVDVLMCARVYVWLCYSVDVFEAWYGEMLLYADENFVSVDDGHLVAAEGVQPGVQPGTGSGIDMRRYVPYGRGRKCDVEDGGKSPSPKQGTKDKVFELAIESPRRSERLRLKRMRDEMVIIYL